MKRKARGRPPMPAPKGPPAVTLPTATIDDLLRWSRCEDWSEERIRAIAGRKKRWSALDVLALDSVPPADRLWVVLRPELIDERDLHELACRFAEHVLKNYESRFCDDRPRAAIAAKRAWLRGEIGNDSLSAAYDAVASAVASASYALSARYAARSATYAAELATYAARSAVMSAGVVAAERNWQIDEVRRLISGDST